MSVKKFIESGVLESYVMGLCTPDELKQVKAMKAKHPTVQDEIKTIRETLMTYALRHEVKPAEQLKEKILSATKTSKKPLEKNKEIKAEEKPKEIKPAAVIKPEEKTLEKKPDVKASEIKPVEVKTSEVKTPEIKTPEVKAPEVKTEVRSTEIKPSVEKKQEIKAPEKPAEQKPPEKKTVQEKLQETKKEEIKQQPWQLPEKKITPLSPPQMQPRSGHETVKSALLAVTLGMLVLSTYFNYYLYKKVHSVLKQSSALKAENAALRQDLQMQTTSLHQQLAERQTALAQQNALVESANKDLTALMKSFKTVTLTGEGASDAVGKALYATAQAMVYWNPASKETYLRIRNLPSPDSTRQYQLWTITENIPVDAGVFKAEDISVLQRMKDVKSSQMFLVTLEKRGGSPQPSPMALCLKGKVL